MKKLGIIADGSMGQLLDQGADQAKINSMAKEKEITDVHQSFRPKRKRQGTKTGVRLRIRKLLHSFPSMEKGNKE